MLLGISFFDLRILLNMVLDFNKNKDTMSPNSNKSIA
jgi:hypothetical protein